MNVDVSFTVALRFGRELSEAELRPSELPWDEVTDAEELAGAVVITAEGQPEIRIEDSLAPLAIWLCFTAVAELAEDRPAIVEAYSYAAEFHLEPDEWWVAVHGDLIPEARFYRPALLPALVACGERIQAFLDAVGPPNSASVEHLVGPRKRAREALESAPQAHPGPDPAGG